MSDRDKLIELIKESVGGCATYWASLIADHLIANGVTIDEDIRVLNKAIPIDEWHEDDGVVLWWRFPIVEPPYVGSPLCSDWEEDYYTHWTPIVCPEPPKGE